MGYNFTLAVHHGGFFVRSPELEYVGGSVDNIEKLDPDFITVPHFKHVLKGFGHSNCKDYKLWYKLPGMELVKGIRKLFDDNDVMMMVAQVSMIKFVHIYVEHVIDEEMELVPMLEQGPSTLRDEKEIRGEVREEEVGHNEEEEVRYNEEVREEEQTRDEEVDYNGDVESENELYDVGVEEEKDDADWAEHGDNQCEQTTIDGDRDAQFSDCSFGINVTYDEHNAHSDYNDSSELHSPLNSSDNSEDEVYMKDTYPKFEEPDHIKYIAFFVGQKFRTPLEFKTAVKNYAIAKQRDIKFQKNTKDRVTAVCVDGCEWRIHASWMQCERTFQVKTYMDVHTCVKASKNRQVSSSWVAKQYLDKIRKNPTWKLGDFKETILEDFKVNVERTILYRAKRKALEIINGSQQRQFKRLWDYSAELLRSNPGSTVKLKTEGHVFQRMYICFEGCKKGFISSCRPFIGVDACHLKGASGGQLMAAIGVDPNNQMFPIAIAIVEAETKDSWVWFLRLLLEDVGPEDLSTLTFMSDQQKGLVPAIQQTAPTAEHRFCVRHLYQNFFKEFKGKQLKDQMWAIAKATNSSDWKLEMDKMKAINLGAYVYLNAIEPKYWCRHAFQYRCKCYALVNNICETFNAYIIDARDKPIITMLEMIRDDLMQRMQEKREWIKKYKGPICPKIQEKIDRNRDWSFKCHATWAGIEIFQVRCFPDQYTVNLAEKCCTCKRWQLCGIPCAHAISAILYKNAKVEDYVSDFYKVETYKRCYEPIIKPANSEKFWPVTPYPQVQPPPLRRPPGRPKKLRRRDPSEAPNPSKVSKKFQLMKCSKCHQPGHNARSCKGPVATRKAKLPAKKKGNVIGQTSGASSQSSGATTQVQKRSYRRRTIAEQRTGSTTQSSQSYGVSGGIATPNVFTKPPVPTIWYNTQSQQASNGQQDGREASTIQHWGEIPSQASISNGKK